VVAAVEVSDFGASVVVVVVVVVEVVAALG